MEKDFEFANLNFVVVVEHDPNTCNDIKLFLYGREEKAQSG